MANLKKILVAYDGSPHSKAALGWAMLLGRYDNAELIVTKVFDPTTQTKSKICGQIAERYAELEKEDRQMLDDVKSACEASFNLKIHVDLLVGHVAFTLLDYAQQKGINLIVAGTKGHGVIDEMLAGSVTSTLVNLSKIPILVVKEQPASDRLQKILVAYDGSDCSKAALKFAIEIGKRAGAKILAVKVADPLDFMLVGRLAESGITTKIAKQDEAEKKLMDDARSAAALKGMEIGTELLPGGNFADIISRYAVETNADMIVAGTLGHSLLGDLLMGSVTRSLISWSKMPVLVVKQ